MLLGRYDHEGDLRFRGRTSVLSRDVARTLAARLAPPAGRHPWTGRTFSAGWGTSQSLDVAPVEPRPGAEVAVDGALDSAGRWRHAVKWLRLRTDPTPGDVPLFGSGSHPAAG